MTPKFHFQNSFATEAEAMENSKQIIGETVIQKQDCGWCVFAVEYPDKEKFKQLIREIVMTEMAKLN